MKKCDSLATRNMHILFTLYKIVLGIGKVGKGIKELPGKLDLRKAFTDKKCEIGSHKIKKSLKCIGRHAGYFA